MLMPRLMLKSRFVIHAEQWLQTDASLNTLHGAHIVYIIHYSKNYSLAENFWMNILHEILKRVNHLFESVHKTPMFENIKFPCGLAIFFMFRLLLKIIIIFFYWFLVVSYIIFVSSFLYIMYWRRDFRSLLFQGNIIASAYTLKRKIGFLLLRIVYFLWINKKKISA